MAKSQSISTDIKNVTAPELKKGFNAILIVAIFVTLGSMIVARSLTILIILSVRKLKKNVIWRTNSTLSTIRICDQPSSSSSTQL